MPDLRSAVEHHHPAARAAGDLQRLANTIAESPTQLRGRMGQLARTLQRVEQEMKGPERAIEAIVREVGIQGARLALSAMPRPFHLPVELTIRAVERFLNLGLGMGR